jgi:hypothetical protein
MHSTYPDRRRDHGRRNSSAGGVRATIPFRGDLRWPMYRLAWCSLVAAVACVAVARPSVAAIPDTSASTVGTWWFGGGLGEAQLGSKLQDPGAADSGMNVNLELGLEVTPRWGLGIEIGGNTFNSTNLCNQKSCIDLGGGAYDEFDHFYAFGEYRPKNSGWRLRAAAGYAAYCTGLNQVWGDCFDTRTTVGASASVGYDWRWSATSPVRFGLRLSGETARFNGLQYSAGTFTLQIKWQGD